MKKFKFVIIGIVEEKTKEKALNKICNNNDYNSDIEILIKQIKKQTNEN